MIDDPDARLHLWMGPHSVDFLYSHGKQPPKGSRSFLAREAAVAAATNMRLVPRRQRMVPMKGTDVTEYRQLAACLVDAIENAQGEELEEDVCLLADAANPVESNATPDLENISEHDMMILEDCWVVLDSLLRFVEISNVHRRGNHSSGTSAQIGNNITKKRSVIHEMGGRSTQFPRNYGIGPKKPKRNLSPLCSTLRNATGTQA